MYLKYGYFMYGKSIHFKNIFVIFRFIWAEDIHIYKNHWMKNNCCQNDYTYMYLYAVLKGGGNKN